MEMAILNRITWRNKHSISQKNGKIWDFTQHAHMVPLLRTFINLNGEAAAAAFKRRLSSIDLKMTAGTVRRFQEFSTNLCKNLKLPVGLKQSDRE